MRVTANGTAYEVAGGTTVATFIRARGLDPRHVVVELRGEALERARYETEALADGDRLELVRAVAGGGFGGGARPGRERPDHGRRANPPKGNVADVRHEKIARARLYVVTGAREDHGDLEPFLEAVLAAGADIVQLREKHAEAGDLLRWSRTFRDAARAHDALFVLNDRPDVALAVEADGVHLGQNDLPASVARTILGPDALIGVSTRTPEQFAGVPPEADYLCAGPVWETPTKPGRAAAGLEYVRYVAARADRPWFAIGGIDRRTVDDAVAAGASRIVVVRAVTEAGDPAAATRALREALDRLPARLPER